MGLDMFLNGVEYKKQETDDNGNIIKKRQIIQTLEIYWRKANAIHNWFVNNIQYGEDDCREYELTKDQLLKLKNECDFVLKNKDKAEEVLPTQEGFFFGDIKYDEWYFNELKRTSEELEKLLKNNRYDWYTYCSSW